MFESAPVASIAPCALGRWMSELTKEDQANLQKWLASEFVTHAALIRQITAEAGRTFDKGTVSAHRNGRCRCSRT